MTPQDIKYWLTQGCPAITSESDKQVKEPHPEDIEANLAAARREAGAECPHCGKPLLNCKCWGEITADAARYRWLCMHPDWHFIERLCRTFVADSAPQFYAALSAEIDRRATPQSAHDQTHE